MAKVFSVNDYLSNHPNRNNFDLTHKVHGSYKMGVLYPFLCKPVVPGDSFRITNECSFRFTPMPFPTQSNMRVLFHYFYVRNKNIWSGFENWIEELEEHEPPYLYQTRSFYRMGSLADYLDIPSNFVVGDHNATIEQTVFCGDRPLDDSTIAKSSFVSILEVGTNTTLNPTTLVGHSLPSNNWIYNNNGYTLSFVFPLDSRSPVLFKSKDIKSISFDYVLNTTSNYHFSNVPMFLIGTDASGIVKRVIDYGTIQLDSTSFIIDSFNSVVETEDSSDVSLRYYLVLQGMIDGYLEWDLSHQQVGPFDSLTNFSILFSEEGRSYDISDASTAVPYFGPENTSSNSIKVSALPFRAYESIYNAFYRDQHGVQPFKIDGVDQFNKYNTTTLDGLDNTYYHLFRHNWEMDAYTSCLPSPMQGETPLVGVNSFEVDALGRMSVELDDGSTGSIQLRDLDNGQQGVYYENVNATSDAARNFLLRTASMGFSIPDFRQVNAYTRWKEMNLRKGARYLDFIKGHFGTSPKYKELDMPEFLGGFTQRVSVNDISNTNGVDNDQLGAIAGQARAIGGSKHGVNHFFDDYGFVVGIMCIVPDNAYDSVLPKHYLTRNPLDMYFPEFSQLSLQPLTHEELCPLQTINDSRGAAYHDLKKVFGYQRPNHDLVWACDTVHGLFRDATGIGNSVICRRFGLRPELGTDFLQIKPEETDTIFNYTFGDEDICLGEIVVKIQAKRPVPYLVVPSIK